jgi:hypothetical protein
MVLPDEFAHDTEQLALFDQVAGLIAPLNPTNVTASHGLESTDPSPRSPRVVSGAHHQHNAGNQDQEARCAPDTTT